MQQLLGQRERTDEDLQGDSEHKRQQQPAIRHQMTVEERTAQRMQVERMKQLGSSRGP